MLTFELEFELIAPSKPLRHSLLLATLIMLLKPSIAMMKRGGQRITLSQTSLGREESLR